MKMQRKAELMGQLNRILDVSKKLLGERQRQNELHDLLLNELERLEKMIEEEPNEL